MTEQNDHRLSDSDTIAVLLNIMLFLIMHFAKKIESYWTYIFITFLCTLSLIQIFRFLNKDALLDRSGKVENTEENKTYRKFLFFFSLAILLALLFQMFGLIGEIKSVGLK